MELLPQYPLNKNNVSGYYLDPWYTQNGYSPHYALDLRYVDYKGEDVLACTKGEVIVNKYYADTGNMVIIANYLQDKTILTRYMHLEELSNLNVGDFVNQGDILGQMGSTGDTTGVHLHFEYWICPKDYNYSIFDKSKYAKDPVLNCYIYPHQLAINSLEYKLSDNALKVVGEPVERDEKKKQLSIKVNNLNCRQEPSSKSSSLGYIMPGIYNILDKNENEGYIWYKVNEDMWIAYQEDWVEILLVKENEFPDEPEEETPSRKDNWFTRFFKSIIDFFKNLF